jgi:LPPG:FO 2-phospho-L-lactate transferase
MSGGAVVLTGGVGGAKLVDGLMRVVPQGSLTAIVNTGDDFRHLGLPVSPDIDTLLYTLSGQANREQGWGREGEGWAFMAALSSLGGPDWFRLGDGDLALHVWRGARLAAGERLSAITASFAEAWGIPVTVLPMSDDPVATMLDTDAGTLEFQAYFVERQCAPVVHAVRFAGAAAARAAPQVVPAILAASAIFIAPSNPWLSVDPILAVPEIRAALHATAAPIVAVSPLVRQSAVKGPTAKLMAELGLGVNNHSIAAHYNGLIDAMLVHAGDEQPAGLVTAETDTLMPNTDDRIRVAQAALDLASQCRG